MYAWPHQSAHKTGSCNDGTASCPSASLHSDIAQSSFHVFGPLKDAPSRCSTISSKGRSGNVTVRQQIGLEEPIIKYIEQKQVTWYGHVQRMAEGILPKKSIEVDAETKDSTNKTEEMWMEGIRKAMNERNAHEGQWEDMKRWSLCVGQRRTTF